MYDTEDASNNKFSYFKISYRQKGKEQRGNIIKGTIENAYKKAKLGSIPVKSEIILKPMTNLKKLGKLKTENKSKKIIQQSWNLGEEMNNEENIKYQSNIDLTKVIPISNLEEINEIPNLLEKLNKFQKERIVLNERFKDKSNGIPGPGSYNILTKDKITREEIKEWPCFRSSTNRFFETRPDLNPSPGQYEISLKNTMQQDKESHSFKMPILLKDERGTVIHPVIRANYLRRKIPGPGTYNKDFYSIQKNFIDKFRLYKKSSMFAETMIQDKFGNSLHKQAKNTIVPGPGSYDIQEKGNSLINSASRNFKETKIIESFLKKDIIPGPAFYKLGGDLIKQSKNINPNSLWY